MKKIYRNENSKQLTAYSAMATALIGTSAIAHGEIIYNDIDDISVEIDMIYDIDIDGDGILDFHFNAGATDSGSWTFASIFGLAPSYTVGNTSNQIIGYAGTYFGYASALSEGDPIGPDGVWLNYPSYGNSAVIASNYFGDIFGEFPGNGEKFLGIKFVIGTELHYGWIRVESDISPAYISIKDYAYETNADQAIGAGATLSVGINELPDGSINIYSFGSTVYIVNNLNVQDVEAKIYDINGKLISYQSLTNHSTQMALNNFATGNYIIKIESKAGVLSKEVFIY